MAAYKVSRLERAFNRVAKLNLRLGIGPKRTHLLTVVGCKTGKPHSTPVTIVELDGARWLVAPYGNTAWVRNARACGEVTLSRRGYRGTFAIREVKPEVAAPVLKAYVAIEPITRSAFKLDPNAPLEDWAAIAPKHPIFRLEPLPDPGA
jgi:deazaflavin-dependent oxidoreductase (nitroreductase family)